MRGHPARPRRQLLPFLRPFHAAAVDFSRRSLALQVHGRRMAEETNRFRARRPN